MELLSEVEEAMVGAALVDQSPQEVSTLNSPSGVPSITIPPDIPIKVEYLPDPIPVPSPLFHFPGYPTSTSTPSSSPILTFYTPHVTSSPALANPSGQEVSHSVPHFRPTPIIGSLYTFPISG